MKYYKNQILTVSIDDIGSNGEGIGRYEGYTLFVKDAVCGDTVSARLTKIKKNYAYARCEKIITPSPKRIEPLCEQHRRCGGCQIRAMSYDAQLEYKENKVKNDLCRVGGVSAETLESVFEPIIGMDDPERYRNKSQYPVGTDREGEPVTGFYAARTHSIIRCEDCYLAPEENAGILRIIISHMKEYNIRAYDEKTGTGTVRHILIRKGFATGQIMVCIVICNKDRGGVPLAGRDELIGKLRTVSGMSSVCVSINNENTNVIMGKEIHTLWGSDRISDRICTKTFEISPLSFYQVNPVQTEKLYNVAIGYAAPDKTQEVWDICCGIGTIALCMADKAKKVVGLEIVPEAIEDAARNAKINKVENTRFICAAAEDYLSEHKDEIHADVVILDPPRKGMDEAALSAIVDIAPSRIVYVSCDSATLARDVKYLTGCGYEVSGVRCTDMFPHTVHVETVVLLGWKGVDEYVHFDYAPEHHVLQRGRVTYREIKEWILDTYGAHVTNLNIAQVKDKCGFEKRENYNKGAEGHVVPKCSPEKEDMIMEAFRHFRMV